MKFISPDERQRWIANNKQNLNGRYISVKDIEAQNNTMESSIEERKKLGRRLTKRQRSWLNSKKILKDHMFNQKEL